MLKNIGKSILWFMLYFVASIVGALIVSSACQMAYPELSQTELLAKSAVLSLTLAAIISIAIYIIYKIVRKHSFDIKSIVPSRALFSMNLGFVANCLITFIVAIVVMFVPESITDSLTQSTDLVSDTTNNSWLILILSSGILVPIMEEIVFRYGIYGTLARSNKVVATITSSLLFGVMHGNLIQGIYATVLGFIFVFLYEKGKNIWYPMIMHMSINTVSVLVTLFPDFAGIAMLTIGIIGLIVCVIMVFASANIKQMFYSNPKNATIDLSQQNDPTINLNS